MTTRTTRTKGSGPPADVLRAVHGAVSRLADPRRHATPHSVAGLQAVAGNAAVQRVLSIQRNKKVAGKIAKQVHDNNGRAPEGYEGGRVFGNFEGNLPTKDAKGKALTYWEYDIYPLGNRNRGPVRIVIDSNWKAYYTRDHYK